MSDYSSDEENDRRGYRRHHKPKYKAMDYITEVNKGADTLINSVFFKMAHDWMTRNVGLDLKHVVFGLCLFAASRTYSKQALKWLEENGTNTVMIRSDENLAQDLELWVGRQPSNQQTLRFLCALPSFQDLEWKHVAPQQQNTQGSGMWGHSSSVNSGSTDKDEAEGYSGYDFVASTGRSLFFFQGKLFALEKGEYDNLKLRCFWGNAKPIQALIRHVQITAKDRSSLVQVHMIRGGSTPNTVVTNKRRTISSIDIAPRVKQDLLTDLQDFFDPETEEWCMDNGAPYRKGYMFYGPPGTGKSSLCTAIASEFHLPIYFIHLDGMDDKTLHDEFQKLPKRCLVLFEEIDTAGIVRRGTMKAVPKDSSSDKKSEAESEETDSSTHKTSKEDKGKEEKMPQRSKVTLGGLLNVLDGPGAKEGRLVIFTTNSPKFLDQALIRPGRIDRKIYLGRSTKLVASITFSRIFGTDPRLKGKIRKADLDRMAKEFGDLVPANTFTPCEIQSYCMGRRGKPAEAVKKFPEWIEEQRCGGNAFNYDIAENPNGTDELEEEGDIWHELVGSRAGNAEIVRKSDSTSTTSNIEQLPETRYQLNRETLELETPSKGKSLASDFPKNDVSHSLDNVPMAISRDVDSSDPNSESFSSGNSVMSDTLLSVPPSPLGSSSFQRVSNFSHPFFSGVRNMYSLDKGLENADEALDDGRTVVLRTVDPIPEEDILVLEHGEEDEEGFDPEFSVWSVGMF